MPLRVIQSPGCVDVLSDDELGLNPGDILIDSGRIAASLGYDPIAENPNKALLKVASRLRGLAIKAAREDGLDGVVRTSNPLGGTRLLAVTGATRVEVVNLSRSEACRRIRKLLPNNRDRQAVCEKGLDRYYRNVDRTPPR